MTTTAKLFWSGSSQAVRLPKAFRFNSNEVKISKQGQKVIIEPIVSDWAWLDDLGTLDDPTFEQAIQSIKTTPTQERDWSCFE